MTFTFAGLQKVGAVDWNDLKLFLAVSRLGSIRAAAGALGVNQSTVNRRMDVLEHALNLVLFDRSTRGFVLTDAGRAIAAAADPIQALADRVRAEADRQRRALSGVLKVTAPHSIGVAFIAPILEAFRQSCPDVVVDYDGSERRFDLQAGEADIALRVGFGGPDPALASDFLVDNNWAVYCSRPFAARHGMPTGLQDLERFPMVALGGVLGSAPPVEAFMRHAGAGRVCAVAGSVPNMRDILHFGLGVGLLPVIAGNQEPDLLPCFGPIEALRSPMWIVTTPEARRQPRVAAFVKVALAWFGQNRAAIERAAVNPGGISPGSSANP